MAERAQAMAASPGFVDAGAWEEEGTDRIVGISVWDTKEAFLAAVPPGFADPSDEVHPFETAPRRRFHLRRAQP